MHCLIMLSLLFTGVILCVAGASNCHTCNCYCGDRYHAASPSYGSKSNPGFSCKDIKTKTNGKQDGMYWITLTAKGKSFPVYCDIAAGGWTMAFKAVSGVNNVYDAYTSGQTYSENVFAALEATNRHFAHYKNRIILNWKDFGASEARVVLYKGGKLLKELKFNAIGSDKLNWFSFSRLTKSPWSDLKARSYNFFSIVGDTGNKRCFFINKFYGGCNADLGWMVVTGPSCPWEQRFLPHKNVILYSKKSGYTNWNTYRDVGVADVLVVYLR